MLIQVTLKKPFKGLSFELQSKFEKNDWILGMNQMINKFWRI